MISASIVTYNHHLLEFEPVLRSLFASPVNVVYVIDHSDDMMDLKQELQEFAQRVLGGEPELKRKAEGGFRLIYIPHENNGYGGGHNVALREAEKLGSVYHLVVNPDVWFGPEVIPALVEYMDAHKEVGQMMPKVMYPNGEIQRLAKMLPTPLDMIGRFCFPRFLIQRRNSIYELRQSGFTRIMNVPYLSGCFMFFRMTAIEEVGMFDEYFFLHAEDIDITRRMHQKYETLYYPKVAIYHAYMRISRKGLKLMLSQIVNVVRYFNKWGWWNDPERKEINESVRAQIGGEL